MLLVVVLRLHAALPSLMVVVVVVVVDAGTI
jgi:hypothetical protein